MKPIRNIQYIVVIQSLSAEDQQTGSELYNDVIKRGIQRKLDSSIMHGFFNSETKKNFIDALNYVEINADSISGGIVIHLETHGSEDRDGLILADRSLINWKDLNDIFRRINIKTCNKLFITMANCNGRYLYLGVDPYQKSPYQAYISSSSKVNPSEILDSFTTLFESLIESTDLISAYESQENCETKFYYKDCFAVFEESLKQFFANTNIDFTNKINQMALQDELEEHFEAFNFNESE